jgi:hypothetical protein
LQELLPPRLEELTVTVPKHPDKHILERCPTAGLNAGLPVTWLWQFEHTLTP